jgi:hypothetical protein
MHRTSRRFVASHAPADDTSFARSSDPCRSFATSESFGETRRRWRARGGIAVGKTWRKPGGTGTGALASGPCAARRVSPLPQGSSREASEKEGRHGVRPCEDRESSRFVPARRKQLQKSIGDAWSRRSSSNAPQKGRQGRVNGDLERRGSRRSNVGGARTVETANRVLEWLRTDGVRSGRGPGWRENVIQRFKHPPKAHAWVAGPGL